MVMTTVATMARCFSLLPWNRNEAITLDLLSRTFLSRPDIADATDDETSSGCAGGVCSIEAQVRPRKPASIELGS